MTGKRAGYKAIFQTRGGWAHVWPALARRVLPVREFRRH